jgi:thiamine kinase-like enzyme
MSDAETYAANLECWSGPVTLKRLDGGISNDNFLVEDSGKKYVVRINGDVPEHGVLRINDYNCNRAAAAVGVAPAVHHHADRALVVDYVESKTLTEEDVREDAMLERVLDLIKRTHIDAFRNARGPICAFWPFRVCRDYAFFLEDNNSRMIPELLQLRQRNEELEAAVGPVDLVLGHNDLLAANLLDAGDRLWLIDWEHAGFTSPLFDLANLASNNALTPNQQEWLLEAYFDKSLNDELRHRFHAMSAASLLREAMWSMVSELQSSIDFDYVSYSNDFYGRFNQAYDTLKDY